MVYVVLGRMTDIYAQLRTNDRLRALYMQIGLTLWRLQELEGVVARYYVLVALAKRNMGISEGLALERNVEGNTFGKTVYLLRDAKKIPVELVERLPAIVKERNWLIHSSLADERSAVHNDAQFEAFLKRMEIMTKEASDMIEMMSKSVENFVLKAGVTAQEIESFTKQTLETWRGDAA